MIHTEKPSDLSEPSLPSLKCYRCPLEFTTEREYNSHCFNKHPKLPIHPNRSLLELEGLEPKENPWE